ncbi:hypothetical protein GJ496_006418 [Pomphorhynchus laevis]|nr:hypothetical protein GJ496_006418 [Pomphorhynchus laevis]
MILHGPPGLGKTSLVNVSARYANYRVHEVNASDDRSVDAMKSLFEALKCRQPLNKLRTLLLLDEIDGAQEQSVRFIISKCPLPFPIVCICNDYYSNSLRPLRQSAISSTKTVQTLEICVPKIYDRIAEFMINIWAREHNCKPSLEIRVVIHRLCKQCEGDLRSCLQSIQLLNANNCQLILAKKDKHYNLFSCWSRTLSTPSNANQVRHIWQHLDSSDDLAFTGLYENQMLQAQSGGQLDRLKRIIKALNLWQLYDTNRIHNAQEIVPVGVHLYLTSSLYRGAVNSVSFPKGYFQIRSITIQREDIIKALMSTHKRKCNTPILHHDRNSLLIVLIPSVLQMLRKAKLRITNRELYTDMENRLFNHLMSIITDFNIKFHESLRDNRRIIELIPNIEILSFNSDFRSENYYALLGLLSNALHFQTLRKSQKSRTSEVQQVDSELMVAVAHPKSDTLNNIQPKKDRSISKNNLMSAFVTIKQRQVKESASQAQRMRRVIEYTHLNGYSNAVRRKIKVRELL